MAVNSQFCNSSGVLALCRYDGVPYLRMEDGDDYYFFGPLTPEQVEAFWMLHGVPYVGSDAPRRPRRAALEGE